MLRLPYILAGMAVVVVLLYATLRTTSTPLGQDSNQLAAATSECQRAIREVVADARFPFQPNADDSRSGQLRLTGSMDSGSGAESERRNYICYLSVDAGRGEYAADSVEVWKSH